MIWLGRRRGYLSDWATQLWVKATGRRVRFAEQPWLDGPAGPTRRIGAEVFERLAQRQGLVESRGSAARGILPSFGSLASESFAAERVAPAVRDFYQATSEYELDAWSQWSGVFRPFGWLLAILFSRRLQQLNVPLSGLDTSRGMTNSVRHWVDPRSGELRHAVWERTLVASGDVLYAGSYSTCRLPQADLTCVKVAFPLPNGNALVIMEPSLAEDGSLIIASCGRSFGDPGFYFVVHDQSGGGWARYVRTMRESIHVYPGDAREVRADHRLTLWGREFLRLHYRLRREPTSRESSGAVPS